MDAVRRQGYYIERGEVIEGVLGVGVPIADFSGKVVAALGACLPEFQLKSDDPGPVVQKMLEVGRSISRELGNR
jgi:DNA-binding IclR family transcriptional regulator